MMLRQAVLLLVISVSAGALRQFAPKNIPWHGLWPEAQTSAEDAYKMMAKENDPPFASLADAQAALEKNEAVFLDARSADEFKAGHIPGARNLPFYELDKYQESALDGLAAEQPLIIYCEGVGCELSFFLGRELVTGGFTNVKIFYGGYPEWTQAGLAVEKP